MNRLAYVILFTPQIEAMKKFYGEQLGLPARANGPERVEFDTAGATLALHAIPDPNQRGVMFRLLVDDVERRFRELGARGVRFEGSIQPVPGGRAAGLWDPEGTHLSLLSLDRGYESGGGPRVGTAIVNCRDLAGTKAFYRNVMGLHPSTDTAWWVEFDTGETRLSLHPRLSAPGRDHHHARPVTWSIEVDDLMTWSDACRARGVSFPTAAHDTPYGLMADIEDPDGNLFIVHEPSAEDVEVIEDEEPHRDPIRKPGRIRGKATSRVAMKPEYRAASAAPVRRRPSANRRTVVKVRGAGPDHSRLEPKTKGDEKKAKTKPAIGRLRKAVASRKQVQKKATATSSRGKVAKRKAGKTRVTAKRGTARGRR
jgi:predicted enzyme related to lactoylglutathione lyase